MNNIEKLKQEQQELKERLLEFINFLNSEEYFALSECERSLLNQQRAGMELYLNSLTNRIYGAQDNFSYTSSTMLPLLFATLSMPTFTPTPIEKELKNIIYTAEVKKE